MIKEQIAENNLLIAAFMGWSYDDRFENQGNIPVWTNKDSKNAVLSCDFNYNKDWNLLMKVVEKINTIAVDNFGELYVVIHPTHCTVREGDGNDLIVKHTDSGLLLDAVYLTIVEFVKWYNKQTK